MRVNFRKVAFFILGVYFLISCYTGYILIQKRISRAAFDLQRLRALTEFTGDDPDWNPWGEEFEKEGADLPKHQAPKILWNVEDLKGDEGNTLNSSHVDFVVEIWGKAAIGLYLWEHILGGELESKMGGVWSYGVKKIHNLQFRFRTGPGVVQTKVPKDTQNLVLVLNGRVPGKVDYNLAWLDYLSSLSLKNVGVVLLGNEQCNGTEWIQPYLAKNGGPIKFLFVVYDSPEVDDKLIYQWPLGVATYRDFPKVNSASLPTSVPRKYMCNFLGTIYKNSSRETLLSVLSAGPHKDKCFIKARNQWMSQETDGSREDYLRALAESDLTLNPVGKNTECYRIYEAMSYGSVPVIEDVMTPGHCGKKESSLYPLRLLKEESAPVIYVRDWSELSNILQKEDKMSQEDKIKRRKNVILWYEQFKSKMRDRFTKVVEEKFFHIHR